uniref:Putative C1q domain containing protein MgC1q64 n=1 Tax=Mytilus galloprovincialis TaxID=29158 RepID=F0V4A1_MYTGA|nr:putative C1q domain containing protein MgC1q64 [Mytilus galloprovincialis]
MKVQFLIVFFLAAVRCQATESVLDLFPEFKQAIGGLQARIDGLVRENKVLKAEVDGLVRENKVLKAEVDRLGGGNVAFSSYMTEASANAQSASVTTGSTIKFDRTEANYGNGYSTSTGKFRAPSTGVYGFSWTLCVDSRISDGGRWKYGEYGTQLMSGSSVIGLLHADTETKSDDACSTGYVIKYVSKDTEVYLRNIYDHTGKILSKMDQTRTTFSGWKLYQ